MGGYGGGFELITGVGTERGSVEDLCYVYKDIYRANSIFIVI